MCAQSLLLRTVVLKMFVLKQQPTKKRLYHPSAKPPSGMSY